MLSLLGFRQEVMTGSCSTGLNLPSKRVRWVETNTAGQRTDNWILINVKIFEAQQQIYIFFSSGINSLPCGVQE